MSAILYKKVDDEIVQVMVEPRKVHSMLKNGYVADPAMLEDGYKPEELEPEESESEEVEAKSAKVAKKTTAKK